MFCTTLLALLKNGIRFLSQPTVVKMVILARQFATASVLSLSRPGELGIHGHKDAITWQGSLG